MQFLSNEERGLRREQDGIFRRHIFVEIHEPLWKRYFAELRKDPGVCLGLLKTEQADTFSRDQSLDDGAVRAGREKYCVQLSGQQFACRLVIFVREECRVLIRDFRVREA